MCIHWELICHNCCLAKPRVLQGEGSCPRSRAGPSQLHGDWGWPQTLRSWEGRCPGARKAPPTLWSPGLTLCTPCHPRAGTQGSLEPAPPPPAAAEGEQGRSSSDMKLQKHKVGDNLLRAEACMFREGPLVSRVKSRNCVHGKAGIETGLHSKPGIVEPGFKTTVQGKLKSKMKFRIN